MLVLSRKLGEKIVIGDNIVITVVKIDRNQIRIGIEAPHDVPVYREEIAPQRTGKGGARGSHGLIVTLESLGPRVLASTSGLGQTACRDASARRAVARVSSPCSDRQCLSGSTVTGPS